jgi:hypothetical protein
MELSIFIFIDLALGFVMRDVALSGLLLQAYTTVSTALGGTQYLDGWGALILGIVIPVVIWAVVNNILTRKLSTLCPRGNKFWGVVTLLPLLYLVSPLLFPWFFPYEPDSMGFGRILTPLYIGVCVVVYVSSLYRTQPNANSNRSSRTPGFLKETNL